MGIHKKLKMDIKKFKPMLLPNELTGISPDWDARITTPSDWFYSYKLDGCRVEIFSDGSVKGRSMKGIPSVHIQEMAKEVALMLQMKEGEIIEAELYSTEQNFSELMHFFRSEDVTSAKKVKEYTNLWNATKQGTIGIYKGIQYLIDELTNEQLEDGAKVWPFPGRDLLWATTWHDDLKLYAFSYFNVNKEKETFETRYNTLASYIDAYSLKMEGLKEDLILVKQNEFETIDELYQAYDQVIISGGEGLVITRKDTIYKTNRYTLKENTVFKIKDDDHWFDGEILSVEEGTVAREGSEKTVNELGRSRTSQLQEDRVPSGVAKGFLVRMDDGQTLTVSFNGYDTEAKKQLLIDSSQYIGMWIKFKGMLAVKIGGLPRHARFQAGDFRDSK